jgi:hypothetical protein
VNPRIDEPSKVRFSYAPALEIAEENCHGLDPLFVRQVLDPLFADRIAGDPIETIGFGLQVQLFELLVRKRKKIAEFSRHFTPFGPESEGYGSKSITVSKAASAKREGVEKCKTNALLPRPRSEALGRPRVRLD